MSKSGLVVFTARLSAILCIASALAPAVIAQQQTPQHTASFATQTPRFEVKDAYQRMEMIATTSKLLTTGFKVPRLSVDNPEILQANPLSPDQIQLSARKPGVTNLKLWDENNRVYLVDVIVYGDARELENLLISEFPDASLRVRPLASSVVISGFVPSAEMVSQIIGVAEDYYPKVINNISVGGAQQVLLHVKVMEVSRTKLRKLGFDWAFFNGNDGIVQNAAGLIGEYAINPVDMPASFVTGTGGETLAFGIVDGAGAFFGFVEALRQNNLAKVLAEPTLTTVSGRPASFQSGGEIPILVPQSLGTFTVEYREVGTRVDFVPIVLANGHIRLDVRPLVSEIDPSRSVTIQNINIPGIRSRWVDTGTEMRAGQTLALAGLVQTRTESESRGIPILADLPWVGNLFRRIEEQENEIELLITVTPEFVDAMDPEEVPPCGPGQFSRAAGDLDFYGRGYQEVPKCCDDGSCANCITSPGGSAPFGPTVDPASYQMNRSAPIINGSAPRPQQELIPSANDRQPTAPQVVPTSPSDRVGSRYRQREIAPLRNPYGPSTRVENAAQPRYSRQAAESGLIGPSGYETIN